MELIYCVLLLHKAGKEINEENLKKVVEAAGIQADEAAIKTLLASLKGVDIEKAISEAAMPVAAAKPEEKKEKKEEKEEKKEEMAAEGLSALFA